MTSLPDELVIYTPELFALGFAGLIFVTGPWPGPEPVAAVITAPAEVVVDGLAMIGLEPPAASTLARGLWFLWSALTFLFAFLDPEAADPGPPTAWERENL